MKFYSVCKARCLVGGKIYWMTKCTTTGTFLPLFSSLLTKEGRSKENEVAKPVLNPFFKDLIDFHPSWVNVLLIIRANTSAN